MSPTLPLEPCARDVNSDVLCIQDAATQWLVAALNDKYRVSRCEARRRRTREKNRVAQRRFRDRQKEKDKEKERKLADMTRRLSELTHEKVGLDSVPGDLGHVARRPLSSPTRSTMALLQCRAGDSVP